MQIYNTTRSCTSDNSLYVNEIHLQSTTYGVSFMQRANPNEYAIHLA